jgi:HAMP domain-containing protein
VKYRIDPSKIKGKAASFKCRVCTHVIMVTKPELESSPPPPAAAPPLKTDSDTVENRDFAAETELRQKSPAVEYVLTKPARKKGMFGVRAKMMLLFVFIPFIFMIGASLIYLWQLQQMSSLLTNESTGIVNRMAEEQIADISTAVAIQVRLYIQAHPELKKKDFMNDMGFKTLAVQKVGLTGYTALYEMPDADGIWRTWAHVQPKIIGIDMSTLKKPLGSNFDGFWKVYTGVRGGKQFGGYYTWKDNDGRFREKFMVCIPVAETPYVIAATTYLDEFHGPIRQMESRANQETDKTRLYILVILGGTLVLIGLIVTVYGNRLAGKIKSLTEVTERISVGDLAAEVETKSRDEIGELAEAIARMQDSIRLSIERLRRRR